MELGSSPRMRGTHAISTFFASPEGSSPRMRGTHGEQVVGDGEFGIIPAYAGNTRGLRWRVVSHKDHPRVCGEHRFGSRETQREWGSSPRMRGTLRRMRRVFFLPGIIPAYAGNTWCRWAVARCPWDHPRVCGEHPHFSVVNNGGAGSSPRMRGTHARNRSGRRNPRIIPAYAGNTCSRRQLRPCRRDHPRVCGEHPSLKPYSASFAGSSPRMRGTPCPRGFSSFSLGIIPAYAGNTSRRWWR